MTAALFPNLEGVFVFVIYGLRSWGVTSGELSILSSGSCWHLFLAGRNLMKSVSSVCEGSDE